MAQIQKHPEASAPTLAPEGEIEPRYLDGSALRLFRSPGGSLRMEVQKEVCYLRVVVRRLRPLSDPNRWITFWANDEVEIGILKDPSTLEPESRALLEEELDKRYFTPIITRIYSVKERFGVHDWEVQTNRGRRRFSVRGLHQNIKQVPPARLLITDVLGNRYDIPDVRRLDPKSHAKIARHL